MRAARYAHVPSTANPRALVDTRSPQPGRYLAAVLGQTLRYGHPASRRLGRARALLGRTGLPEGAVAFLAGRFPRRARPEIDRLLEELAQRWPELASASSRLPEQPSRLSVLVLERPAATVAFIFGAQRTPLLVAKLPRAPDSLENEARALREAERAAVAPRFLGRVREAYVQEGLPGAPLRVESLSAVSARRLGWSESHHQLGEGLTRLAASTSKTALPREFREPLEDSLDHVGLAPETKRAAAAAWRDVQRLEIGVLRHRDTSPQNCLFEGARLVGLVDWELAHAEGAPGFDAWNGALAFLEHGTGLRRWSERRAVEVFRAAWEKSEFWREAALAARKSARAAGVPDSMLDSLELAFFARRLLTRLSTRARFPTGPEAAARMLEVACGR